MTKKAMSFVAGFLASVFIALLIVAFFYSFGPKLWDVIKIGINLVKPDTNNINELGYDTTPTREIAGQLMFVSTIKMEDQTASEKPTSPDHCLVFADIRNTGKETWNNPDKIRATLFCDYSREKQQPRFAQNYPAAVDYITDVKPGEQRAATFRNQFPNNCLESYEQYKIVLYSNCEGSGVGKQSCDNMDDQKNPPKILSELSFICKKD